MSPSHLLTRALHGATRRPMKLPTRQVVIAQSTPASGIIQQLSFSSIRYNATLSKLYDFRDIQKLSTSPESDRYLIGTPSSSSNTRTQHPSFTEPQNVREPHELKETGTIPTAINIPLQSSPEALFLSPQEFEDKFDFEKPEKDKKVVFFCKAGVRSRAAAGLAREAGYSRIGEYNGSWMDWEKNGGKAVKSS